MVRLLGARLDHKDPQSRAFQAELAPTIKSVRHRHYGPILDQWVGSCTGHSSAQALNTKPYHLPRTKYELDQDAMAIYHLATQLDPYPGEYPPTDTGSSVLAAAKAAQQLGKIKSYTWAFGYDQFQAALMIAPVLVGTNWLQNMFNPDRNGFLDVSGSVVGGHAYPIVGYAAQHSYYIMINSWGVGWGNRGFAKIKADDMRNLIGNDGDAVVYVKG